MDFLMISLLDKKIGRLATEDAAACLPDEGEMGDMCADAKSQTRAPAMQ
jgi:hypothetical protein